jgi:molybdopterin-guanine dinucleotide biosynthesis protein A
MDDIRFAAILRKGPILNYADKKTIVRVMDACGTLAFDMSVLQSSIVEDAHPSFATHGLAAWWKLMDGFLILETIVPANTASEARDALLHSDNEKTIRDMYKKQFECMDE